MLRIILLGIFLIPVSSLRAQSVYILQPDTLKATGFRILPFRPAGAAEEELLLEPIGAKNELPLFLSGKNQSLSQFKYLILKVRHENLYSVIFHLRFYAKDEPDVPRLTARIGINPRLETNLIFPLSYLDAQHVFLPRFPRQLKGTVSGHRVGVDEVGQITVSLEPFDSNGYAPVVMLGQCYLSDQLSEPLPGPGYYYVDSLGQWNGKQWPGKLSGVDETRDKLSSYEKEFARSSYPASWSIYGGWKEIKFEKTGFFRTHFDGTRWWLVDPDGYAFLSIGMDCVNKEMATMYTGNEDLFCWVPDISSGAGEAVSMFRDNVMVNFLKANLIRCWGKEYPAKWTELTRNMLKTWRFNTIGNWSDLAFARMSGVPYVIPMSRFPTTPRKVFRDFPDVFDTLFVSEARKFASQLLPYRDDQWMIGYFLANEPEWAFGNNNIALEMLAGDTLLVSRKVLADWLRNKYQGSLAEWNREWNSRFESFDDVKTVIVHKAPSEQAEKDLWEFSGMMVERLIGIVCEETKKVDPHHLNLGLRYAWISSDLCYRAAKYFDVFSINGYRYPDPPPTEEITRRSGKPVLIGEFHFGSTDRGLPATGIVGVAGQEDRGRAYSYYMEHGFARPEIVGIHYFQWLDQPVTGRFDGENYNIGFMDVTYQPYRNLVKYASETNEKLYQIASGLEKPTEIKARSIPAIFY